MSNIKRIGITAGHNYYVNNMFDPGAVKYPYTEADIVKDTVKILIQMLQKRGYEVKDLTPYDQKFSSSYLAHVEKCRRVDEYDADIFLDVHLNAFNETATGTEVWVYSTTSKSYPYATQITNNISSSTGLKNRGVKVKPSLWSLYLTKKPAMIIEGAFVDNASDMKALTPEIYAKCIADVFVDTSKPIDIPNTGDGGIYRVRKEWADVKTQQGAYSGLENAIRRAIEVGSDYKVYNGAGKQIYPVIDDKGEVVEVMQLTYKRAITKGFKGDDVKELQRALLYLGYDPKGVDGHCGNGCYNAILQFQRDNNLVVDGWFGKASVTKINRLLIDKSNSTITKPKPPTNNKQYEVLFPDRQTTVIKIRRDQIDKIDSILANTKSNVETLGSMQKRTGCDFIINGVLFWYESKTKKHHSLNLLIDEYKQVNEGVYSRYGLMTYKDGSYKFDWYKWTPDLKDMQGGSPSLVINGIKHIDTGVMEGSYITSRHPRSAIGMNNEYIFLVTIDGRNASKGHYGMTINELANYMMSLGCRYAIANDGGGSARVMHNGKMLNSCPENRAVLNGIGIFLKK